MTNKLDPATRREWEAVSSGTVPASYSMLENFVTDRCQMLEAIPSKKRSYVESTIPAKRVNLEGRALTVTKPSQLCAACRGEHFLGGCNRYRAKSIDEKLKMIKRFALCYNCFKSNHTTDKCRSGGCFKCDGKHHTSIHREKKESFYYNDNPPDKRHQEKKQITQTYPSTQASILPTAIVLVHSLDRAPILGRVLLDSGSQFNFATKSLMNRLGVPTQTTKVNVTIPVLVSDNVIGSIPSKDLNTDNWNLSDVNLADPDFHLSSPVDILLGVSIVFDIIRSGNKDIGEELPRIQNTALGWVIGGGRAYIKANTEVSMVISGTKNSFVPIEWTEEKSLCEQLFVDTTTRTEDGRFIVRLPRKPNSDQLGDSKTLALGQFLKLEKRFEVDPLLHQQYSTFISEYLELGHMSKVNEKDLDGLNGPVFYSPHHPVFRPESATTKLRVVFNASAASSSGLSLNDVLMTGPTIQQDTFNILLRFRFPKYVLIADLEKMFRQILVHETDCQLQYILWRFSSEEAVSTYRLNTVTYGTCSAPYVAARCLKQVAIESKARFPQASSVIETDFYMDDMVTGLDDLDELIELKEEITAILNDAGFKLHKWNSNSSALVPDDRKKDEVKILGLRWNSKVDVFGFQSELQMHTKITKRNVLSDIQKIYDPLGMLSPLVVHADKKVVFETTGLIAWTTVSSKRRRVTSEYLDYGTSDQTSSWTGQAHSCSYSDYGKSNGSYLCNSYKISFKHHSDGKYVCWPDKASSHYAKETLAYLKEKQITYVPKERNPTNLPQCRPIEDFFSFLSTLVYKNKLAAHSLGTRANAYTGSSKPVQMTPQQQQQQQQQRAAVAMKSRKLGRS
ncbi:uncharacterized protein LOC129773925 [Toxorhynchites rutilus septentrionalis]|uniref:uncharacterized protein LOC129773925 n=1 Tax=Toxorhynchites rutilus septentrionalis TaxID=329112 RepID=UPI00247AFF55|nr:uncharacterized protein LOC129773925 [Toxorhynchites rutilus septentrionalis]